MPASEKKSSMQRQKPAACRTKVTTVEVGTSEEMTDEQFDQFMLIENDEIPLASVNFRKKLRTRVSIL